MWFTTVKYHSVHGILVDAACQEDFVECHLRETLFENYTTQSRPVLNPNDTLFINGSYHMVSLSKIVRKHNNKVNI